MRNLKTKLTFLSKFRLECKIICLLLPSVATQKQDGECLGHRHAHAEPLRPFASTIST